MSIVKDSLTAFSARLLSIPLILAAEVFVARLLGPEGKGIYQLVVYFLGVCVLFGNIGIGQAIVYHMGRQTEEVPALISNVFTLACGLGLVFFASLAIFAPPFQASFLRGLDLTWILLAVAFIPIELINWYFTFVFLGLRQIWWFSYLRVVRRGLTLIFLVLFVWFFQKGVGGGITAYLAAVLTTALVAITVMRRRVPFTVQINLPLWKQLFGFGSLVHVGNLSRALLLRLDIFFVNYFVGTAAVGFYSVAIGMAEILWHLPNAFATILFQRVSESDEAEADRMTPWVCRHVIFLSLMVAVGLMLGGKIIISTLFGTPFLPALTPLYFLLPGVVAIGIFQVLSNDILGRGRPILYTLVSSLALVLNIALNVLLIPSLGIVGAAVASSVSYVLASLLILVSFLRLSRSGIVDTLIIKRSDLRGVAIALGKMANFQFSR